MTRVRRILAVSSVLCMVAMVRCDRREPEGLPKDGSVPAVAAPEGLPEKETPPIERADTVHGEFLEVDRWLFVDRVREGAKGGWATGTFDKSRNKLSIHLNDVAAFTVHVSEIPIDWTRPVVLSLDNVASELRRRAADRLHCERDRLGAWVIVEPPQYP